MIVTVERGGLSIFSTGEASSEAVDPGGGVRSGVAVGEVPGAGDAVTGVPEDDEGVAGVAGCCEVDDGASEDGAVSVLMTWDVEGDKAEVVEAVVADSPVGIAGAGMVAGASAGDEAGWAGALGLFAALPVPLVCSPNWPTGAGPIRSSSPASEPLTLR